MGTPLGPKYIPYTYMDPLGQQTILMLDAFFMPWPGALRRQVKTSSE